MAAIATSHDSHRPRHTTNRCARRRRECRCRRARWSGHRLGQCLFPRDACSGSTDATGCPHRHPESSIPRNPTNARHRADGLRVRPPRRRRAVVDQPAKPACTGYRVALRRCSDGKHEPSRHALRDSRRRTRIRDALARDDPETAGCDRRSDHERRPPERQLPERHHHG